MSIVRFASLCDNCGSRSQEYTEWPMCRECLDYICPPCEAEGTMHDNGEGRVTVLCPGCKFAIDHDGAVCEDPARCPVCTPGCLDLQIAYNKLVSARSYCLAYGHPMAAYELICSCAEQVIDAAGGSLDIDGAHEGVLEKWQRQAGHGKAVVAMSEPVIPEHEQACRARSGYDCTCSPARTAWRAAEAKVAELERERDEWAATAQSAHSREYKQAATIERLTAYTSHKPGCEYYNPSGCTCGLDAALSKQPCGDQS